METNEKLPSKLKLTITAVVKRLDRKFPRERVHAIKSHEQSYTFKEKKLKTLFYYVKIHINFI